MEVVVRGLISTAHVVTTQGLSCMCAIAEAGYVFYTYPASAIHIYVQSLLSNVCAV